MIAQRLSANIRWIVAGAPSYLQRFGTPESSPPRDLVEHRCVNIRLGDDRIYRWEFEKDDEKLAITVPRMVIVDHAETGLVGVAWWNGAHVSP